MEERVWRFIDELDNEKFANVVSGRYWVDVYAGIGRKWYFHFTSTAAKTGILIEFRQALGSTLLGAAWRPWRLQRRPTAHQMRGR